MRASAALGADTQNLPFRPAAGQRQQFQWLGIFQSPISFVYANPSSMESHLHIEILAGDHN
jgi:hypothetical protein